MKFPRLFEPCHIGKLELSNRVVIPPMTSSFPEKGLVTDQMVDFYVERARGGASLFIVEDAMVDAPIGCHLPRDLWINDDRCLAGLSRLAKAIKDEGCKAFSTLSHGGRVSGKVMDGYMRATEGLMAVAPSAIALPLTGFVVPRELTIDEIQEIEDKFADAAERSKKAGFDGINLHCTHLYLIEQFLSLLSNKREDAYGGSFDGRLRFLLEIVRKCKQRVGDDFPMICRISGEETADGGLTIEDAREIARRLEAAGVHGISVSIASSPIFINPSHFIISPGSPCRVLQTSSPMRSPRGCLVHLAAAVKEAVSIPVMAANRIVTPEQAEQILEEGKADIIHIGRGVIADPEWPKKAREGREKEIRYCIGCLECHRVVEERPLACAVNSACGREREFAITPAAKAKSVFIAGGGLAGMEAARVAAVRGHKVRLYEKDKLGGQVNLAVIPPGKEEMKLAIDFGVTELNRLGIQIIGKELTPEIVRQEKPDVVIVAIGAHPILPEIRGVKNKNVITAWQALQGASIKGRVVVIGGGQVGAETAEYLANKGYQVTIVEMLEELATDAIHSIRDFLLLSLEGLGVSTWTRTTVEEITEMGVTVTRKGQRDSIEADTVVLAVGHEPNRDLAKELDKLGVEFQVVGDCTQVGKVVDAIESGFRAGLAI